ncbi:MAG: hypothetical protein R3D68_07770 [Hyphomicrobiaceae bacterium]
MKFAPLLCNRPLAMLCSFVLVGLLGATQVLAQQAPTGNTETKAAKRKAPNDKSAKAQKKKEQPAQSQPQGKPEVAPGGTPMPNARQTAVLIQTFMVALSQASLTNNYTVLNGLGAPSFQKENSPEKLSRLFAGFRNGTVDLTPIIVLSPVLVRPPDFTPEKQLRLTGYYPTAPKQIHFELLLQPIDNVWRLFGISVEAKTVAIKSSAKR